MQKFQPLPARYVIAALALPAPAHHLVHQALLVAQAALAAPRPALQAPLRQAHHLAPVAQVVLRVL